MEIEIENIILSFRVWHGISFINSLLVITAKAVINIQVVYGILEEPVFEHSREEVENLAIKFIMIILPILKGLKVNRKTHPMTCSHRMSKNLS